MNQASGQSVAQTLASGSAVHRIGNVRWVMIGITFLVATVAYLDRSNISIAAPLLAKELSLSDVQLGFVFSAFVLGYAVMQPVAGWFADRFGAYRTIAIGIGWWSVLTALTAMIRSDAA